MATTAAGKAATHAPNRRTSHRAAGVSAVSTAYTPKVTALVLGSSHHGTVLAANCAGPLASALARGGCRRRSMAGS
jgi:hypothetical protein